MTARRLLLAAYLTARAAALMPLRVLPRRPVPRDWRKILLVRIDRIGDLVLSTPFLRNLREAFPAAHVALLGTAAARELLSDGKLVDRIEVYDRTGGGDRVLDRLRADAFDIAVDMHCDYIFETALLTRRVRARCSVGFDVGGRGVLFDLAVPAREPKHFVEETLDLLRPLGVAPRTLPPQIALAPRAYDAARGILTDAGVRGDYVVFHPGGFYRAQQWPAARFAVLAARVAARGYVPVFIGGRSDAALLDRIAGASAAKGTVVCGQDVGVAAAVIGGAVLFVGNNSGPLHVACALSVPSVSTMGPTDPIRFWPVSDRARVVRARTVDEISVDEMFAAVRDMLPPQAG